MKKTYLLVSALLLVSIAFGQANWTRTKIDDQVSVELPVVPQKQEVQGMTVFAGKTKDSTAYSINIIDFSSFGMDSAMLQSMVGQEMFLEQFKAGMTQQMPGAEIKDAKMTTIGAYTAYDIIIELTKEGKKLITHSYNVFIGSKDYSFVIVAGADVDLSAEKEKLIKSIQIK
jgi:hypothetical protein